MTPEQIDALVREAMKRSEALVRDALKLGREMCRPDPSLRNLVIR